GGLTFSGALTTSGSNGTIALIAHDAITSSSFNGTLTAPNVVVVSTTANAGTSSAALALNANNITAQGTTNVYLSDSSSGDVTFTFASVNGVNYNNSANTTNGTY